MKNYEQEFFQRFKFTSEDLDRHLENALRDLDIARKDSFPEVRFTYSYQALIKAGITLIGKEGYKVRSVPGHHVKILDKMSEILDEADILTIGNAMRMKRNFDFYGGGESISEKEANDYLAFVEKVMPKAKKILHGKA